MKKTTYIFIAVIFMFSCQNNNDKADAYGNFEAREIMISSEAGGKILQFNAKEGDLLKAGDTICKVETELLEIKKEQITAQKQAVKNKFADILAQVKVLEEKQAMLKTEKNRLTKLFEDSVATQKQMDKVNSETDILKRQIEQVKVKNQSVFDELSILDKQMKFLNKQISKATLINPTNGTLLQKYAETFEITAPGKVLYKIADISEMILKAYVSGDQLSDIKIGKPVDVFIDKNENENLKYTGKVVWIADKSEFTPKIIQTKKERVNLVYAIKIRVKNDGKIKIGMPGEIRIKQSKE